MGAIVRAGRKLPLEGLFVCPLQFNEIDSELPVAVLRSGRRRLAQRSYGIASDGRRHPQSVAAPKVSRRGDAAEFDSVNSALAEQTT